MKIVVLDGYGLNPGDLSWEEMWALGELTVYDRTAPAELLERSAGAEVLITNKTVITAEDMAALPALKYIGVLATGYNIVDIQAGRTIPTSATGIPTWWSWTGRNWESSAWETPDRRRRASLPLSECRYAPILPSRSHNFPEEYGKGSWMSCSANVTW